MKHLRELYNTIETRVGERVFKLIRYLISGGSAALVNWGILFLLVHMGTMYYLHASILSFIISVGVSFSMQKFWTFRDNGIDNIHTQFARYVIVIGVSLLLNTGFVYFFVEYLHVWYLLAQIIATIIIATTNFIFYKHFVFHAHVTKD